MIPGQNEDSHVWYPGSTGRFTESVPALLLPEGMHGLGDTLLKPAFIKFRRENKFYLV